MRLAGPGSDIRIPWAEFVRWREDARVILLYASRAHFHTVPKPALASGARDRLRSRYDAGRVPGHRDEDVSVAAKVMDPDGWWVQVAGSMLGVVLLFASLRTVTYLLPPPGVREFRRHQPNLDLPWRVEPDAQGLRALTPQQDVRTDWGEYIAWAQHDRVVLVYRSDALFQFLPVRALDVDFLATFQSLVAGLPRR